MGKSISINFIIFTIFTLFILLIAGIFPGSIASQEAKNIEKSEPHVIVLTTQGAIGPAVADYITTGIEKAELSDAALVVYQMDTPGGLDNSMRDIIQAILTSEVPVVTYVAPDGARAASAGTYILYASHVAAMSPATNLGAATPIQIGGFPGAPESPEQDGQKSDEKTSGPPPQSTLEKKIVNDAAAYIKSLAERHGRNVEWAEKAVREAVSLSASEALELGVVDIVAADLNALLQQVDGREVNLASGKASVSTKNLEIVHITQSWKEKVMGIISDPNIAYILLLLGVYGLIFEVTHPGLFLPGIAGAISLILALYAFQILPVNYSGLALIVLGIGLIVSEAFLPSFGVLGIGGIIAFVVGSFILIDEESLRIAYPVIGTTTAASALFIAWLAGRMFVMRGRRFRTGSEGMIGMTGEAIDDFEGAGRIWLMGESWQAKAETKIKKGERVKVTGKDGLELSVATLKEDQSDDIV